MKNDEFPLKLAKNYLRRRRQAPSPKSVHNFNNMVYPSVKIGSKVLVDWAGTDKILEIVSVNEVDAAAGRFSPKSSLGQSLMNKKIGTHLKITTPSGHRMKITIKNIKN